MSWAGAGVGLAAGLALAPVVELVAAAVPRRRGLDPAPLPHRLPALAVALALLLGGCGLRFDSAAHAALAGFYCAALVCVVVADLEYRLVPNEIVLPSAAIVLAGRTALDPSPEWAIAAAAVAGFLLLAALVYPAGLGMGDVKLALLIGAMLGRGALAALVIGFASVLPVAVVILVRHGSAGRKMAVPFAPFLALGGIVVLFVPALSGA